jgi:GNAT superfamily N-acetyltransferase
MDLSRVVIREAEPRDARRIAAILDAGSLHPGAEDTEDATSYAAVIGAFGRGPSKILVAVADHQVVGVVQLIIIQHLQRRGGVCAELESVHVAPEFRGHGVGGLLVEDAVRRAAEMGCYRVQLTSNVLRPDAHRFYEAHGFTPSHVGFKRTLPG